MLDTWYKMIVDTPIVQENKYELGVIGDYNVRLLITEFESNLNCMRTSFVEVSCTCSVPKKCEPIVQVTNVSLVSFSQQLD